MISDIERFSCICWPFEYLFFFFGKMSIHVLPPFLVALFGFFFLFTVELHEFVFSNLANYR